MVVIVVEQDTGVIVHCHVYNVNGIISNLDRCRTFCHVVVEAYQQQGRTVSVWYIRPILLHPLQMNRHYVQKVGSWRVQRSNHQFTQISCSMQGNGGTGIGRCSVIIQLTWYYFLRSNVSETETTS